MPYEAMKDPRGYITEVQALKAIECTDNVRDELLLKLLWYTGARITEILNLQVSMIDETECMISIRSLKKKREVMRSVPVPKHILKDIMDFIARGGSKGGDFLFSSDGAQHLSRQQAYTIVNKACEKAGVTSCGDKRVSKRGLKPHPHMFRHGFAMNWLKKGGRPEQLQNLLGHESYETTRSYQRFTNKDLQEAYDKINQ